MRSDGHRKRILSRPWYWVLGARVMGAVGGLLSEGQHGSQGDAGATPIPAAPHALARVAPQPSIQSPSLSDTCIN